METSMFNASRAATTATSKTIYAFAAAPPKHAAARLAAPAPGKGPMLRMPGVEYRRTGFKRPNLSSVAGASTLPHRVLTSAVPMPNNFSWLPSDLVPVLDQGNCGSCWAHSLVTSIADRVSAQSGGKIRSQLSVRNVQECSDYLEGADAGGCEGNDTYTAVDGLVKKKTVLRSVKDYPRSYEATASDPAACGTGVSADAYGVVLSQAFLVSEKINNAGDDANKRNIENIKQHIYNEGPVIGSFKVYSDFMDYDGLTIYEPGKNMTESNVQGYHAIEMVGWGMDPDSGTPYWICRNSWGKGWPTSHKHCAGMGFFYFKMGTNVCDIEAYVAGATPVVQNSDKAPKDADDHFPGESSGCPKGDHGGNGAGGIVGNSSKFNSKAVIGSVVGILVIAAAIGGYAYMRKKQGKKLF